MGSPKGVFAEKADGSCWLIACARLGTTPHRSIAEIGMAVPFKVLAGYLNIAGSRPPASSPATVETMKWYGFYGEQPRMKTVSRCCLSAYYNLGTQTGDKVTPYDLPLRYPERVVESMKTTGAWGIKSRPVTHPHKFYAKWLPRGNKREG